MFLASFVRNKSIEDPLKFRETVVGFFVAWCATGYQTGKSSHVSFAVKRFLLA